MAHVIEMAAWAKDPARWHGDIEGAPYGMGMSLMFFSSERQGAGPRLHTHPYPETFIIQKGRALYTIGDQEFEAVAGQVLVCPADTPHKFVNIGPGVLESIDIHASETFETSWLE
jgi:mannose-6-phosphate isomerase-like protein (cupin superfamily)